MILNGKTYDIRCADALTALRCMPDDSDDLASQGVHFGGNIPCPICKDKGRTVYLTRFLSEEAALSITQPNQT